MAYRNRSTRRLTRKSRQRFFTTLIIIVLLFYVLFTWVLPFFINGVGTVTNIFKGNKPLETSISENPNLAPPVLNIPYEATSSAKIDIQGFATANSTVKIYLDDELVQEVTSDDDGTFRAKSIMLVLGTNNIYGKTEDETGKESLPSKTIKLIYDSEKPTLEVSSPEMSLSTHKLSFNKFALGLILLAIFAGQLIKIPIGGSGGPAVIDIVVLLLDAILLFRYKFKLPKPPVFIKPAAVFIIIAIISLLLSPLSLTNSERLIGFFYTVRFSSIILLGWLLNFSAIKTLLISGVILSVLGLLQFIFIPDLGFLTPAGWDYHYFR